MPQTILAILAMVVATLFAHHQQRSYVHTQLNAIRNEVALQGTGVAEDVLGEIGAMAFDRETEKLSSGQKLSSPYELTSPPFEARQPKAIEDFHDQTLNRQRVFRGETLHFKVEVEVAYVDAGDMETEQTSQTKAKKATATVYNTDIKQPVKIRVARSYTCGSKCDW